MIRRLLGRLDAYGTGDPDFNEGHPEDRCPLCERAVIDHPARWPGSRPSWRHPAKWPHRRAAAIAILLNR